jgi:hypothetical protein
MAHSTLNPDADVRVYELVAHGFHIERREHLGYVHATSAEKALDVLCKKVNAGQPNPEKHVRRDGDTVIALGVGAIKAHEVS